MNNKPQILYADDDSVALRLMEEIALDDGRFEVLGVTSGEDAVRNVSSFPGRYDLIILDVNLGLGLTGGIIKEKIEKIDPNVKIVFLSNYNKLPMSEDNPDYWFKGDLTNDELAAKIVKELEEKIKPLEDVESEDEVIVKIAIKKDDRMTDTELVGAMKRVNKELGRKD